MNKRYGIVFVLASACAADEVIIDDDDEDTGEIDDAEDLLSLSVPVTLEAESMTLNSYTVTSDESSVALTADTGSVKRWLDGDGATYDVKIHVIAEAGGQPTLDVLVDGVHVTTLRYPLTAGAAVLTLDPITIGDASQLELVGHRDGTALATIDRIDFARYPLAVAAVTATCSARNGTLTHTVRFDTADLDGAREKLYPGSSIDFTTKYRRHGAGAVRLRVGSPELSPAQCGSGRYRAEMVTAVGYPWDDGKSHWLGLSMYPTSFEGSAYTLLQIHAPNETKGSSCKYDGNALSIVPESINGIEHYTLRVIENGGRSSGKGASSGSKKVWTAPMRKNQWADFVIDFSLSRMGNGFFRVWRNGSLVYQKSGLTNVNYIDSCGRTIPADKRSHNGPHFGIYGPGCGAGRTPSPHFREMFMDELRAAHGPNAFGLVSPSCL